MPDVIYNLYEAKTSLSKLVERASQGEEIYIAKAGKPKAKLVPIQSLKPRRTPGAWKGLSYYIADDFDAPLPSDIQASFEGESDP